MTLFYFSFADATLPEGEQFLGGLFIEANNVVAAVTGSHVYGLNPGGEILTLEVPDDAAAHLPDEWKLRLLTREQLAELDDVMGYPKENE
jgi:hypothetical protein